MISDGFPHSCPSFHFSLLRLDHQQLQSLNILFKMLCFENLLIFFSFKVAHDFASDYLGAFVPLEPDTSTIKVKYWVQIRSICHCLVLWVN
jgi:hypothetical protein